MDGIEKVDSRRIGYWNPLESLTAWRDDKYTKSIRGYCEVRGQWSTIQEIPLTSSLTSEKIHLLTWLFKGVEIYHRFRWPGWRDVVFGDQKVCDCLHGLTKWLVQSQQYQTKTTKKKIIDIERIKKRNRSMERSIIYFLLSIKDSMGDWFYGTWGVVGLTVLRIPVLWYYEIVHLISM